MAALRIGATKSIRRNRPAAGQASRAGDGSGQPRAVRPRDRRPGLVAVARPALTRRSSASSSIALGGGLRAGRLPKQNTGKIVADLLAGDPRRPRHRPASTWSAGPFGDVWALSLAEHHPSRVARLVLLGGGPVGGRGIRAGRHPCARVTARRAHGPTPGESDRLRSILRESGHGASLRRGRVAEQFIEWRGLAANDTSAIRHEREMVRGLVCGLRAGGRASCTTTGQFARIDTPNGARLQHDGPDRHVELWRRVVERLPYGDLQ